MKAILYLINNACIFFGTTLYAGVLWSLHFFWFPSWTKLTVANYYDQFIPQTSTATRFFTVVVPIMFLCNAIMIKVEWKTRMRWASILALICVSGSTYVGQMHIIPINKILKGGIADQARLTDLLSQWMHLNDIRWVLMTVGWLTMMYYFGSKSMRADAAGAA
jgi:hypothetical protein